MVLTSSAAAKLLRSVTNERDGLLYRENSVCTFNAALGEDIESVRPEYDMKALNEKVNALEADIRKIKHAINIFNTTTVVPEFGMTIDEVLVYIPQLTARVHKLSTMKARLPKEREHFGRGSSGQVIDYCYANYDVEKAEEMYKEAFDELSRLQLALDNVNATYTLEIDIAE